MFRKIGCLHELSVIFNSKTKIEFLNYFSNGDQCVKTAATAGIQEHTIATSSSST
jgi:hypothetical protein